MKKLRKNNGITLIALVITIIVLLILAGVTIATLTGDNGILTQANKAKTSNTEGEASEQFALLANEWAIEKNTGSKTLGEFLNGKITEGELSSVEDNGNGTYTIKLNGYQTIIDQNGKISSVFNPEEWDKTATPEDCFIWGSDTEGEEGYDIIVGYTSKLEGYIKLRFPSRCTKIDLLTSSYTNASNDSSRSFCSAIKTVELPNTVTEVGRHAFASSDGYFTGFDNLESIIIPDSVTSIGYQAFFACDSINNITILNSVTAMENDVFKYWTSSQTIKIQGYSSAPEGWDSSWNNGCSATINWNQ